MIRGCIAGFGLGRPLVALDEILVLVGLDAFDDDAVPSFS